MEHAWSIAGPLAILALVGLTKYHSGNRPLTNLGLAFEKSPRVAGCLVIVMAAFAWDIGQKSRIPGFQSNLFFLAPMLTVMFGSGGLLFLLLGPAIQRVINLDPGSRESTSLQSVTMWTITVLSVLAGLAGGVGWWN